jgi:Tat protein translocase TatB subunit
MFSGIGIWEVLLIIVVILIVLGPQRVPEIARKLGQIVRTIRRASTDLSMAVTRELDVTKDDSSPSKEKSATPDSSTKADKPAANKPTEQPAEPEEQKQSHE